MRGIMISFPPHFLTLPNFTTPFQGSLFKRVRSATLKHIISIVLGIAFGYVVVGNGIMRWK